jgi:ABC-type phosphate transport system substrate-binding protein
MNLLRCLSLATGLLAFTTAIDAAEHASYWVIVSVSNPVTALSKRELSYLFLKKQMVWSDKQLVLPVDQGDAAPVRRAFSMGIHGKSISAVKSYWQQRIFSGREVPPPELGSNAEVTAYVKAHPGAVGYLSERPTDSGVKLIRIVER